MTHPKTLVTDVRAAGLEEKDGYQNPGAAKRLSSEIAGHADAWTIRSRTRVVLTGRVLMIR